MRIGLISLVFIACLLSAPVMAADKAAAMVDGRTVLASKIHDKVDVRAKLFKALETVTQFMTPTEKADFWEKMNKAITTEEINAISIKAMANTYTEPELQAMLDFYSSPAGQSAEEKRGEYEKQVTPEFSKLIDRAVAESGVLSKPQIDNLNRNLLQR